jgi:hypothetical protein
MALRNHDRRAAFCLTTLADLVLLVAVPGIGLAIAGCGGSSEAPAASSETAGELGSTDSGMSDATMMSSPEMGDPTMNSTMDASSMESSMVGSSITNETGSEFGDTSLGHGEGEPGSEAEMLTTGTTSTEPSSADAAMSAQMAAAETAANPSSNEPSEPGTDAAMSAQMAAAEAAATGQPGIGNESGEIGPEAAGPGPNGEGGGAAQEPPVDSPDYPAFKVVMGLMQGNHEGLKDFISTTGRGLTEKIRGGSLTIAEKDDLKKTFAQPQLVGTPRTIRGSRTVLLNSGGQVITLVSKKQGASWKVSSISIKAASKR